MLKKAIYGLKQAGRQWFLFFQGVLLSLGFTMSPVDNCLFYFQQDSKYAIFIFHVDDFMGGADSEATTEWLKTSIEKKVELSHFGRLSTFIGLEFQRNNDNWTYEVRQTEYIDEVVRKFRIPDEAKPCNLPAPANTVAAIYTGDKFENINIYQQLVGALMYLNTTARKDISFTVNLLCRLMQAPTKNAWEVAKCCLKYLKTKRDLPLVLGGEITDPTNMLLAFSDADWAVDREGRRSTTGCVVFLNGHCIFSETRLQQTVALHSVESEYYALSDTTKSVLFFRALIKDCDLFPPQEATPIYLDSAGAKAIAQGGGQFRARKHIDVRHHFVFHHTLQTSTCLLKTPSHDNTADTNTKALGSKLFGKHSSSIMCGITN